MTPEAFSTPLASTERPVPVKSAIESPPILILPVETVSPADEASPPVPTDNPPVKVLVAETVETMEPPAMVPPPLVIRRSFVESPPERVLVAVVVWNNEPPVRVIPFPDKSPPFALSPEKKVEVPVVL